MDEVNTFYHKCLCSSCSTIVLVPVQRQIADVPEKLRERVFADLQRGLKLLWPDPGSREDTRSMEYDHRVRNNTGMTRDKNTRMNSEGTV